MVIIIVIISCSLWLSDFFIFVNCEICIINLINVTCNDTRFERELKKCNRITKQQNRSGIKHTLDFEIINKCLIGKQYI